MVVAVHRVEADGLGAATVVMANMVAVQEAEPAATKVEQEGGWGKAVRLAAVQEEEAF